MPKKRIGDTRSTIVLPRLFTTTNPDILKTTNKKSDLILPALNSKEQNNGNNMYWRSINTSNLTPVQEIFDAAKKTDITVAKDQVDATKDTKKSKVILASLLKTSETVNISTNYDDLRELMKIVDDRLDANHKQIVENRVRTLENHRNKGIKKILKEQDKKYNNIQRTFLEGKARILQYENESKDREEILRQEDQQYQQFLQQKEELLSRKELESTGKQEQDHLRQDFTIKEESILRSQLDTQGSDELEKIIAQQQLEQVFLLLKNIESEIKSLLTKLQEPQNIQTVQDFIDRNENVQKANRIIMYMQEVLQQAQEKLQAAGHIITEQDECRELLAKYQMSIKDIMDNLQRLIKKDNDLQMQVARQLFLSKNKSSYSTEEEKITAFRMKILYSIYNSVRVVADNYISDKLISQGQDWAKKIINSELLKLAIQKLSIQRLTSFVQQSFLSKQEMQELLSFTNNNVHDPKTKETILELLNARNESLPAHVRPKP